MTDLTEQLYDGTLPTGHYYFNNGVETYIVLYSNANTKDRKMQEPSGLTVVSEVPSYEEYLSLTYAKEEDERIIAEYEAENDKLKELLKEAKKREDIIRKQLKDAQKVMIEDYSSLDYLKGVLSRQEIGNYTAQESLEKIAHDWEKDLDKYCKKWCEIKY